MKPISLAPKTAIDGSEVVYAADQPEYQPLVAWRWPDGTLVTRWRLSWRERFNALLGHDLYFQLLTFNQPLQPLFPTFDRREVINEEPKP